VKKIAFLSIFKKYGCYAFFGCDQINAFFHEEESLIVIDILAYVSLKEKIGIIRVLRIHRP